MTANISRRTFLAGTATSAAAVAALGLAGCGAGSSGAVGSEVYGSSKGIVIAAVADNAPFTFSEDSQLKGLEVELASAAFEIAEVECQIQAMTADEVTDALADGTAVAALGAIDDESEDYDYSSVYYDSYVCAAGVAGSKVLSLKAAKNKQVACVEGGLAADWAETLVDEYGYTINYFATSEEAVADCTDGDSVLCIDSFPNIAYGIQQGSGLIIVATNAGEYTTSYGLRTLTGENSDVIEDFNSGIAELRESGEYDEIVNKYLS